MDGSNVGSRSTELVWIFSPEAGCGAWGPPLARTPILRSQSLTEVGCNLSMNDNVQNNGSFFQNNLSKIYR